MSLLLLSPGLLAAAAAALVAALAAALCVYVRFFYVDLPPIPGLPEIPGGDPLAGHLHLLGADHATTAEQWARNTYGWPVFQIRMGRRRAVVLNSFGSARTWLVTHQAATLDRPWFHTFHGVVSATSAATIGTSPWNERTKKQRRIVGALTTAPAIQRLARLLDLETAAMVARLYEDSGGRAGGGGEIMPHVYEKRVALNLMCMFCYGTRFASVESPLFLQILSDASTIASFRSSNASAVDFVPHLRFRQGARNATAVAVRSRRDTWLASMLDTARATVAAGKSTVASRKTVAAMLLSGEEGLTTLDIRTILGGLMSGGFETIFSTAIIATGVLASPAGQRIQQAAYDDLLAAYATPEDAFAQCVAEEKSAYVAALVKEALRVYPPLKLLPARQTYKAFAVDGAVVPKGVLLYVNAQAANRDPAVYGADADQFRPERWLPGAEPAIPPPYHFAFGAGARMCTAVNLSNRVLYAVFVRLIIAFRLSASGALPANTDYIAYKEDPAASNAIPSAFQVRLAVRDRAALERSLARSQVNVADMLDGEEVLSRE